MTIPNFNARGSLDKGIYQCTAKQFYDRFCQGQGPVRAKYREVLKQLFAFSIRRGARSVIIAGSFVTDKPEPSDLDCIVIFPNEKSFPKQIEESLVLEDGCELDIMFGAETNKAFIYSMLNMFSLNEYELSVGMVEVVLDMDKDGSTWSDYSEYNSIEKLMEARAAYVHRKVIRGVKKKKMLVTVCNANEYLLWNYNVAPIVSSSGWTFAPYFYESKNASAYIEHFHDWIENLYIDYETAPCIFADGIGSYLLGKYINNEKRRRVELDKIILSRAVLNPDFEWMEGDDLCANLIVNLLDVDCQMEWKEELNQAIKQDAFFGEAYRKGFTQKHRKLIEHPYSYRSDSGIEVFEFQEKILPLFHISDAMIDNVRVETRNHREEIIKIAKRNISLSDAFGV